MYGAHRVTGNQRPKVPKVLLVIESRLYCVKCVSECKGRPSEREGPPWLRRLHPTCTAAGAEKVGESKEILVVWVVSERRSSRRKNVEDGEGEHGEERTKEDAGSPSTRA